MQNIGLKHKINPETKIFPSLDMLFEAISKKKKLI